MLYIENQIRGAVSKRLPIVIPSGLIEFHGEHLPVGVDLFFVQDIMRMVKQKTDAVFAPPVCYCPTGFAVSGLEDGTVDIDLTSFKNYVQNITASYFNIVIKNYYSASLGRCRTCLISRVSAVADIFKKYAQETRQRMVDKKRR